MTTTKQEAADTANPVSTSFASKLRIGLDVAALVWPILLVYTTFRLVEFRVAILEKQVEAITASDRQDRELLIEIRTQLKNLVPSYPVMLK